MLRKVSEALDKVWNAEVAMQRSAYEQRKEAEGLRLIPGLEGIPRASRAKTVGVEVR